MLYIFSKPNKLTQQQYSKLASTLPPSRKEKLKKLSQDVDKKLSIIEYYAVKKLLKLKTNQDFNYTQNGKPYIADKKHFSIAHSNNLLCVVTSKNPIGIDVQPLFYDESIAKFICTKQELDTLYKSKNKAKALTKLFTQKESAIKCLDLNLTKIKTVLENNKLKFKTKRYKNYLITVCKKPK